jgi:ABC-type microcin C transport system duplicated ATPase subunit YejF
MTSPVLSLRNVSLTFPRGRRHVVRVLSDVSLDICAGELVAVLAQQCAGQDNPAAGRSRDG